jgi:hypothetical protein
LVPNPEKVFRHTHARKAGLNVPGGLLPIAGFCYPPTGPDPSTLLRPDFDPLTLSAAWIEEHVLDTFKPAWPPHPIPLDQRIRQLTDELGERAALSWSLRWRTPAMPKAWAAEYRKFFYEVLGKPEPIVRKNSEPVLVRTIEHVRWLGSLYRKRRKDAEKRRRKAEAQASAVAAQAAKQAESKQVAR